MVEAMEDGAMGVSQALIYPPSAYTDLDELVAISKVVSKYNGVYITHLRSEADEIMEGLEEAIERPLESHCTACFCGDYPLDLDEDLGRKALE